MFHFAKVNIQIYMSISILPWIYNCAGRQNSNKIFDEIKESSSAIVCGCDTFEIHLTAK